MTARGGSLWDQLRETVRLAHLPGGGKDALLNLIVLCEKQDTRIEELERRVDLLEDEDFPDSRPEGGW